MTIRCHLFPPKMPKKKQCKHPILVRIQETKFPHPDGEPINWHEVPGGNLTARRRSLTLSPVTPSIPAIPLPSTCPQERPAQALLPRTRLTAAVSYHRLSNGSPRWPACVCTVCELSMVFTFLKHCVFFLKKDVTESTQGPQSLKYLLFGPLQKVLFITSKSWSTRDQR